MLSRRVGEDVLLTLPDGRRARVVVTGLSAGKVRLGFDAPRGLVVHRSETRDRVDTEGERRDHREPPSAAERGLWAPMSAEAPRATVLIRAATEAAAIGLARNNGAEYLDADRARDVTVKRKDDADGVVIEGWG